LKTTRIGAVEPQVNEQAMFSGTKDILTKFLQICRKNFQAENFLSTKFLQVWVHSIFL